MSEYIVDVTGLESGDYAIAREEIVRCMDCVWFTNSSHYGAYCTNFGSSLGDDYDGFCAWGERK